MPSLSVPAMGDLLQSFLEAFMVKINNRSIKSFHYSIQLPQFPLKAERDQFSERLKSYPHLNSSQTKEVEWQP